MAGFLLALGYLVQIVALLLAAARRLSGYLITLLVGLTWAVAATVDHLGEVLAAGPYREGIVSKGLEVGVVVLGLALAVASAVAGRRAWRS